VAQGCSSDCATLPYCGDGNVDPGEDCDDANEDDSDSCIQACTWNQCGDGRVYVTSTENSNPYELEACDDQNLDDSDSCVHDCTWNECGDGWRYVVESSELNPYAPEVCDDGNGSLGDRCTALCDIPECGDSVLNPATEECDNGGSNSDAVGSSCSTICTLKFTIGGGATCGNGVQDANEQCDGADDVDTDACVSTCRRNTCGDGFLCLGSDGGMPCMDEEECDDGNDNDDDGCTSTCELARCGDGFRQVWEDTDETLPKFDRVSPNTPGNDDDFCSESEEAAGLCQVEECDDGDTTSGDGCSSTCAVE
jgi:cysteine-rich repeat protein